MCKEGGSGMKKNQADIPVDPTDPRSSLYSRKLHRPDIHWFTISLWVLLPIAAAALLIWLLLRLQLPTWAAISVPIGLLLAFALVFSKRAAICLVKIYQRYAPARIRKKCRFEPSCSEYMLLSLEKYGFWKGAFKGLGRIKRCHNKDGGFDYP